MGFLSQWIGRLSRSRQRFSGWDEFFAYFKEIEDDLEKAGLSAAAQELRSHLEAGESPLSGYWVRIAGVLDGIIQQNKKHLPRPLVRKLREAIARLAVTANLR